MKSFPLSILSAVKPFYEGDCLSLVVPTVDGSYGVLAGHADLVIALVPGEMQYTAPDGQHYIAAISEGILKIEKGKVLMLADTVERPDEIDENMARRSAEAAKEALLQKKSIREYYAAEAKMARALNRIRVKKHGERRI